MRNHFLVIIMLLTVLIVSTGVYPTPAQAQAESIVLSSRPIKFGCDSNQTYIPLLIGGLDTSAYYRMQIRVRRNISGDHYMTRQFVQQPAATTVNPFGLYVFAINDLGVSPLLPFPMVAGNQTFIDVRLAKSTSGETGPFTNVARFRMYRYNCADGTYDTISTAL